MIRLPLVIILQPEVRDFLTFVIITERTVTVSIGDHILVVIVETLEAIVLSMLTARLEGSGTAGMSGTHAQELNSWHYKKD